VNQNNIIKSMIPQGVLGLVPPTIREVWADRIVKVFREHNPQLYEQIGEWSMVPEESSDTVLNETLAAAEKVYFDIKKLISA